VIGTEKDRQNSHIWIRIYCSKDCDQILDLRTTLRYLGVPVNTKSYMFGDNQAVVTNSAIPHSSLNKRYNALSYHRVREMIAAKILEYYWID
jgi:hypothetical protein